MKTSNRRDDLRESKLSYGCGLYQNGESSTHPIVPDVLSNDGNAFNSTEVLGNSVEHKCRRRPSQRIRANSFVPLLFYIAHRY